MKPLRCDVTKIFAKNKRAPVNCILANCSKIVVLMPVKFVLWLISGVLLVLHGKMDTNANEDAFGDYGWCKIAVHCNL